MERNKATDSSLDPANPRIFSGSFIRRQLQSSKPLPPITLANFLERIIWFNVIVVSMTPLISLYGLWTTRFDSRTFKFCVGYFLFNMIGYHRLWSHRSYTASKPLQYFLAIGGVGAIQGSILWWCKKHRCHHRYTDTELDPYDARQGLLYSHIGWMLFTPSIKNGPADIGDLKQNPVVTWQHKWFFPLALIFGLLVPSVIPGVLWGDWWGGLYFAGFLRLTCVHHAVFSINSIAHWLGETTYDDKLSPRDSIVTAFLTLGEGYHNFHHQFPMDYRNAVKWYQWDPTKWFIAACNYTGLASKLLRFPDVEVRRSEMTMQLKSLKREYDKLPWPATSNELPVVDWETFQKESNSGRHLILITGFIHDVGKFLDYHPGGRRVLEGYLGKDATTTFFGGIYDHSNAAQNLLASMRVGVLQGGLECISDPISVPCMRLRIVDTSAENKE
ncbi:delta 9-fatty acid desaturase protein [Abortiporus biennis]|nr:delta 9-fatty acid desaturase protein [Abortiporus biennis]